MFHKAKALSDEGAYAEALPLWKQLLSRIRKTQPLNESLLYTCLVSLGECYSETENYPPATAMMEEALRLGRKAEEANLNIVEAELAWLYKEQGELEKAVALFEKAFVSADADGKMDIAFHLGDVFVNVQFERAVEYWEKGLELAQAQGNVSYMNIFWERLVTYHQARELHRKAIAYGLARVAALDGIPDVVSAHMDLAAAYEAAWQPEDSLKQLRLARQKMEQFPEEDWWWEEISVWQMKGNALLRQGKAKEAENCYRAAFEKAGAAGDEETLAAFHYDTGLSYLVLENYQEAESHLQKAINIGKRIGYEEVYWPALAHMAAMAYDTGDYQRALAIHEKMLPYERDSGNQAAYCAALNNLAAACRQLGQLERAEQLFEESGKLAQELGPSERALFLRNQAGMQSFWGNHELALSLLKEALQVAESQELFMDVPRIRASIAEAHYALGYYKKAKEELQQLEGAGGLPPLPSVLMGLYTLRGIVEDELRNDGEAERYLRMALQLVEETGMMAERPTAFNNLGVFLLRVGRRDEALPFLEEALEADTALGQQSQLSTDYHNLGFLYHENDDYQRALEHFVESVRIKESLRRQGAPGYRMSFLDQEYHTYELLAHTLVLLGREEDAFRELEKYRSRELLAKMAGRAPAEAPRFSEVQQALPEGAGLLAFANSRAESLLAFFITKREVKTVVIPLRRFFETDYPGHKQAARPEAPAGRASPPTGALNGQPPHLTFRLKRQRSVYAERMESLLIYYRQRLQRDPRLWSRRKVEGDREVACFFYRLLLEPFSCGLAGCSRLFLCPDDVLSQLPFDTLVDEQGSFLAETHSIQLFPSASVFLHLKKQLPASWKKVLAVGLVDYQEPPLIKLIKKETGAPPPSTLSEWRERIHKKASPTPAWYREFGISGWRNLPFAEKEIKHIEKEAEVAELLIGKRATPSRLLNWSATGKLRQFDILHFATHAISLPFLPELSALVLAPEASNGNSYLTLMEAEGLQLQASLVFLSACETSLGKLYSGEGAIGLASAFLAAGSHSVIASLWAIHDEHTARFVQAFYRKLKVHPFPEALASVKQDCIRGRLGPELQRAPYWGGFVMWGG